MSRTNPDYERGYADGFADGADDTAAPFTAEECALIARALRTLKGASIYKADHETLEALALKVERTAAQ